MTAFVSGSFERWEKRKKSRRSNKSIRMPGTSKPLQVDARSPLRRAILQHPSGIALMNGPKFVVINNCIGDGRDMQGWDSHFFNARAKRF